MSQIDLISAGGLLGDELIMLGNTQKYRIRGSFLLDFGVIFDSATVEITAGVDAGVSAASLADDRKSLWFFVTAPTADEKFTVTVTIMTSDGQTLVYTLDYTVET